MRRILVDAGYPVVCANSAPAALRAVESARPGIIVADGRALSPSGREELTSFASAQHIPLVFGRPDRESLVTGVESALAGRELSAKETRQLVAGPLRVDLTTRMASLGETPLDLTAREFDLLAYLARHPGWVYSREELLEQVWGYEYGDPQVVTVHVANMRKKLKAIAPEFQLIETVQSIGYRLAALQTTASTAAVPVPSSRLSGLRSRLSRTRIVIGSVAAAVILLGLGLGLGLGLRGQDEATPSPDAVPDAEIAAEGTMGIDAELLSATKTYADVTGEIPEGKFLVTADEASQYNEGTYILVDPATIWSWLQQKFHEGQPDITAQGEASCILWLGDQNEGVRLNAAVTNRLFIPEGFSEENGYKRNFVGALPSSIPAEIESYYLPGDLFAEVGVETALPGLASGVLVSLIPAASPEEPETQDHYMEVHVPFLDETFYARISLDEWGPVFGEYFSTRVECLDLRTDSQRARPYEWFVGEYWLRTLLFTEGISLSDILQPGDWVILSFSLDESLAAPFLDSRGVQYINQITVQRLDGPTFESIRDLLYPGEDVQMGIG
jgi:DNA-binding response OmpR family regulator